MNVKDWEKPKIIVILGPTASGKSELAVKLAKKFNGEIISADSRQVYRGLDIGSGKVPRDSIFWKSDLPKISRQYKEVGLPYHYIYKGIIHHLLDVASPKKNFTVAQYQKLAKKALKDILKRGKLPIICGGTGLYIDSIIYSTKFPEAPPRPKLRKKLEKLSSEELFKKLQKFDSRRAENIDKHNRRRLIRALEIIISTGKPVPSLKQNQSTILSNSAILSDSGDNKVKVSPCRILKIGVNPPKKELRRKIAKRIKQMFKNGLLDEIKNLRKQNLSWNKIYSFGFEYKYPALFLQNKINKKEMFEKMLTENWRYAKRQMTWFKKDKNIRWVKNEKEAYANLIYF